MLNSPSSVVQEYAVKRFIESGRNFNISIQKLYPLDEKEKYEIIQYDRYERDQKFMAEFLNRRFDQNDDTMKAEYYTTSFKVDIRLHSEFSSKLLETMAQADEEILMSNLKYILREIWRRNIYFSWFYAMVNWLATCLFFIATVFYKKNFWYMLFSCIFFFILLFFEIVVAIKDVKRYFKSKYNYVDIVQYIAMPLIMWINFLEILSDEKKIYNGVISVTMLFAAGRALTMLRVIDGVRYLVAMILQVFKDMQYFMYILIGSIFAFALIDLEVMKTVDPVSENPDEPPEPKPEFYTITHYFYALDAVYNLAYGAWEGSAKYNFNQYFHFLVNTMFIPLILLNLLIAIISKTFEDFEEKKEVSDIKETVSMLLDFNYFIQKLRGVKKANKKKEEYWNRAPSNKNISRRKEFYLHLIKEAVDEEVDVNERLREVEDNIEKVKNEVFGEIEKVKKEVIERLEESGDHVRKNAETNTKSIEKLIKGEVGYEEGYDQDVRRYIEKMYSLMKSANSKQTKSIENNSKNILILFEHLKKMEEENSSEEDGSPEEEFESGEEENNNDSQEGDK